MDGDTPPWLLDRIARDEYRSSDALPHGATALQTLLEGSIVFVRPATVLHAGILYAMVGAFHYVFRKPLLAISLDPAAAAAAGVNVRLWDFLFYVSFGFVVTSSVAIAGVLLVFSYLVIPAVTGVLFARTVRNRLLIGWTVGTAVSFLGGAISWYSDVPSGPAIVVTFAAALILAGLGYYLIHTPRKGRGLARIAIGAAAVGMLVGTGALLKKSDEWDPLTQLLSKIKNEQLIALKAVEAQSDLWEPAKAHVPDLLRDDDPEVRCGALSLVGRIGDQAFLPIVLELLRDPDDLVRDDAITCLRDIGGKESVDPLLAAAEAEEDSYLEAELGEAVLDLGDPRGIPILVNVMDHGPVPQVRQDAYEHLSAHTRIGVPFRSSEDAIKNDNQIAPFREWWRNNAEGLRLGPDAKVFEVGQQGGSGSVLSSLGSEGLRQSRPWRQSEDHPEHRPGRNDV